MTSNNYNFVIHSNTTDINLPIINNNNLNVSEKLTTKDLDVSGTSNFNDLDVSGNSNLNDLVSSNATFTNFNLQGHKSDLLAYPGTTLYRAVGYAPLEFSTLAAKGTVNLNRSPSKQDYSFSNNLPELFSLPIGAKLLKVTLTNNGTTITAEDSALLNVRTYDVTTDTSSDFIFSEAVATGEANTSCVNNAEGLSVYANVIVDDTNKFGSSGVANPSTPITITPTTRNIRVQAATEMLTDGDLAVVFEYTL